MESGITERAREFMESSRKKKKKERERERAREIRRKEGYGIKWNLKEKRDDRILQVYVCGGQNAREKEKEKKKKKNEMYG